MNCPPLSLILGVLYDVAETRISATLPTGTYRSASFPSNVRVCLFFVIDGFRDLEIVSVGIFDHILSRVPRSIRDPFDDFGSPQLVLFIDFVDVSNPYYSIKVELIRRQQPQLFRLPNQLLAWLEERYDGSGCLAGRRDDAYFSSCVFWKPRQIQEFVSRPMFPQYTIGDQLVEIDRGGRQLENSQKRFVVPVGPPPNCTLAELRLDRPNGGTLRFIFHEPDPPVSNCPNSAVSARINCSNFPEIRQESPGSYQPWHLACDPSSGRIGHRSEAVNVGHGLDGDSFERLIMLALPSKRPSRDYMEALAHAHRAVELIPEDSASVNTLALAEYRSEHWAESVAAAERAMKMRNRGNAEDWFVLALAHRQ
jgi:hypothetical protein